MLVIHISLFALSLLFAFCSKQHRQTAQHSTAASFHRCGGDDAADTRQNPGRAPRISDMTFLIPFKLHEFVALCTQKHNAIFPRAACHEEEKETERERAAESRPSAPARTSHIRVTESCELYFMLRACSQLWLSHICSKRAMQKASAHGIRVNRVK